METTGVLVQFCEFERAFYSSGGGIMIMSIPIYERIAEREYLMKWETMKENGHISKFAQMRMSKGKSCEIASSNSCHIYHYHLIVDFLSWNSTSDKAELFCQNIYYIALFQSQAKPWTKRDENLHAEY